MTHTLPTRSKCALFLAAAMMLGSIGSMTAARADEDDAGNAPPPSVARVSVADGSVGVKSGDNQQVAASVNAPVEAGDYITTGGDGRAEVQLDSQNLVRAAGNTQIRFTQLDGQADTVQLAQGTVELRVLQADNDNPTVQTPSADIVPDEAGAYLVTVDQDGLTQVTARSGSLDVNTPQGTQTLQPGRTMEITGNASSPQYQYIDQVGATDFDSWADGRDQQLVADAGAYQNVNSDTLGAPDLDQYGSWQNVSGYGEAWQPNNVAPNWTPYSDGNWTYAPYYGWTWVSAEPWGWAPYHYGRWAFVGSSWYWVPGPRYVRPVYSPALVAFFGFGGGGGLSVGLGFGFGNIGWVPLAPGEMFHPWWGPGRSVVFNNVAVINNYRNYGHGLVGVPVSGWQHGDFTHIARVSPMEVRNARVVGGRLPFAPTAANYRFTNRSVTTTTFAKPQYQRFNDIHSIGTTRGYGYQQRATTTSWQHFSSQRAGQGYVSTRNAYGSNANGSWQRFGGEQRSAYNAQSYTRPSYARPSNDYGNTYRQSYNANAYRPQQSSTNGYYRQQSYQRQSYQPQSYQRQSYQRQSYQRQSYQPQSYQRQSYNYQRPSYQQRSQSYSSHQSSAPRSGSGGGNPHGHTM